MENLFYSPISQTIHEKFDLKGSTVGRHVTLLPNPDGLPHNHGSHITLKDMNFQGRTLHLLEEIREMFLTQIEKDCELLEDHNICDYSLLVGICRLPLMAGGENIKADISIFRRAGGGILSSNIEEQ